MAPIKTRWVVAALLLLAALLVMSTAYGQNAASLQARHVALQEQFANSPFQKPLVLESRMTDGSLVSDVYAVIAHPYLMLGHALQGIDHWCEILMLHLNVKNCLDSEQGGAKVLRLAIGRKHDQVIEDAYQIDFKFRSSTSEASFLTVQLSAEKGPFGTGDYRIAVEAVPIDANSSFIRMSYSYAYGVAARMAMDIYLATLGRNKVGFSVIDRKPNGAPVYVGGVRGVVERNTMRYYLAIEAFLAAYHLPAREQSERRLRDWFAATERYPRQLRELSLEDYLSMKRSELARQRGLSAAPN